MSNQAEASLLRINDEVREALDLGRPIVALESSLIAQGLPVPYNLETGELLRKRWRAWLRHDPILLVGRYAKELRTLRGIFVDCGWRDQYRIHYGSRLLSKALAEHGIAHRYEEFDDNHSSVDYRMELSLPFLARALS